MTKRGSYRRQAPKPTNAERLATLEGRFDALASAFAELDARLVKAEVAIAGPQEPEPRPPFR